MFYAPDEVVSDPEALRAFVKQLKSQSGIAEREELKTHFEETMSELRQNVPELQLLMLVSAALGDNSPRLEILQPFHAFCFVLLKQSDVEISDDFKAAPDMEDDTAEHHDREKRSTCSSLEENDHNGCLGMCGPGCNCWKWFCGDCCWNQGCYEHDRCCRHNEYSSYCKIPYYYGITCQFFNGYSKCLEEDF